MKCKYCNAEIAHGEKYCSQCGKKVKHTDRNVIIGCIICAVLLIISTCVLSFFGIATVPGVSSLMDRAGLSSDTVKEAKTALSDELDKLLNNENDLHFISETGEEISSLQGGEIQQAIMSSISYSLSSRTISGNSAEITVEFAYPDVVALANEYVTDGKDSELFAKWLTDNLSNEATYINAVVVFTMEENNGGWIITIPNELYNVLTGGMQRYIQEREAEIINNLKEGLAS